MGRFREPVTKRIQWLAANSCSARNSDFFTEQAIYPAEQGIRRVERRRAEPRALRLPQAAAQRLRQLGDHGARRNAGHVEPVV
jgi:hypothetical protein